MNMTATKKMFATLKCFALLGLFSASPHIQADELVYPKPAYGPEKLQQVRQWEQQWVGTKISADNCDQVREFLPESLYGLIKDSAQWGVSWFTIAPYRQIMPTPGEIALTQQFAGSAKIGPHDEMLGWSAGIPFPNADDGLTIAYNFKCRNNGDGIENSNTGFIIDARLKYALVSRSLNRYCYWAGRYDTPPIPEFPNNRNQIWRTRLIIHADPPENRNMKTLEIQYKDELTPYDAWMWLPATRRVQRRTASAREDAVGGVDYCEYDSMGYDGPIQINSYALIGTKEYLWARHIDTAQLIREHGATLWSGVQRERCTTYVVEVKSKDPTFIYPRQIWYIDPETWQILYAERYDRSGRLWRILDQFFFIGKGYNNVDIGQYTAIQSVDLLNYHATILKSDMKLGMQFDTSLFTKEYLQKNGY